MTEVLAVRGPDLVDLACPTGTDCDGSVAQDAYGSALQTPATDAVTQAPGYDSYGRGGGLAIGVSFGYRSELHTGDLVHLRARDYDPATGTFLSPDPLDGVDGTTTIANPYHYADNDPLNKTDPTGLRPADDEFDLDDETPSWAYVAGPVGGIGAGVGLGTCFASVVCGAVVTGVAVVGAVAVGTCTLTDVCSGGGGESSPPSVTEPQQPAPPQRPVPAPQPDSGGQGGPPTMGAPAPPQECWEGDDVTPEPINRHHSDPIFMGGARNQPLTPMPRSEHVDLHCAMNDFLDTKMDAQGNTMRPKRGNDGRTIRRNFSRPTRLRALADFYNGPGSRFSSAARDFFAQHPGLR